MKQDSPLDTQWLCRLGESVSAVHPDKPLDRLLPETLEQALALLGLHVGWIYLWDERSSALELAATAMLPAALAEDDLAEMRWSPCTCHKKVMGGSYRQVAEVFPCQRLNRVRDQLEASDPTYHISYPLWVGARYLGVMNLVSPTEAAAPTKEILALGLLANQLALRLMLTVPEFAPSDPIWHSHLHAMNEVITMMVRGLCAGGEVFEPALTRITALCEAQFGALALADERGRFDQFWYSGVSSSHAKTIGRPPVGSGVLGALLRDGEILHLRNVSQHPESVGFPPNHPPMKSFLGVPVMNAGGRPVGRLYLANKTTSSDFFDVDRALLEVFAQSAVIMLQIGAARSASAGRG